MPLLARPCDCPVLSPGSSLAKTESVVSTSEHYLKRKDVQTIAAVFFHWARPFKEPPPTV